MKITNNGISSTPLTPPQPVQAGSRESTVDGVPVSGSGYTPSAEWVQLIDQLNQEPEIRMDRVQAVLDKLNEGGYLSADSAEQTADAMMNALD
jgi:hypothetical protein